ncbi:alpha/beta fold hydrolase [Amylibacter sp. IMCC11727]|uniref:alpha/beta hydrolase n=1 Tax=Amylibacter sp. IMCC11727 TaxID=3039851 RepID=UPI00244E2FA1|nr:alpha/beta fold hydrolase [Amylibacter sp. IMCC11727]WGI22447.1 alpha/beta hydrolase [Amylibacter sp. IMCC11727]
MKRSLSILFTFFSIGILLLMLAGRYAVTPNKQFVGPPPSNIKLAPISLADADGNHVSAWYYVSPSNNPVVLLLHGIKSDKRSMLPRAQMLIENEYSVVLIDLQAHGESDGKTVTFGHLEAVSVQAAYSFIERKWPDKKVGVIGSSLGGAAAILAGSKQQADAYVLEAVFSDLKDATENRLRVKLGDWSVRLSMLLLWQAPLQIGVSTHEISPKNKIEAIQAPILVIAGTKDQRTTLVNSRELFSNANSPKEIWEIPEARHQDFYRFAKTEYTRQVLSFFDEHLQ